MYRDIKFDWNDVSIVPASESEIESRSEITPTYEGDKLPLFVSPMDTVVDKDNYKLFLDEGFEVCAPRHSGIVDDSVFVSVGIQEFETLIGMDHSPQRVLVDIANGHMKKLMDLSREFKAKFPDHELMVGNIANPKTYELYCHIGVDYVRVGIGGGSACTTSANGGVHYPMGSLVSECAEIGKNYPNTKIVADGGFRTYSDVIKGLALGADYIMLGGILNKCLESCSPTYLFDDGQGEDGYVEITDDLSERYLFNHPKRYKKFRGMSTKEVQKKWGRKELKTSEGIVKYNKVEYTLSGWTENLVDYLKTNMSYCNKRNLSEYIGGVEIIFMTQNAFSRFNK